MKLNTLLLTLICVSLLPLSAQPVALVTDISISKLLDTSQEPVRIVKDPLTNEMYYLNREGEIYQIDTTSSQALRVFNSADHGLTRTIGMEIGATGNIYVVADEIEDGYNIGKIAKASPDSLGGYTWTLMAETEAYRVSGNRDHRVNAVIESKDGQYIYVNSGSRTDHGEEASNDGLREMPITSAILKIPIQADQLVLLNNEAFLDTNGYIFADGIRNTFDMAYSPDGELFGVENSDTRDNEEELNWLQEGHHYGFPWEIGTHQNPQQFANYSPPGSDNLLVQGINMEATFYNDPTFPAPPAALSFTGPILNTGPHANIIRDSVDGVIKNASDIGRAMGTFTPHSSPVALSFDTELQLGGAYTGHGFAMSYNSDDRTKYEPFLDPGEDLLWLQLSNNQGLYQTQVTRIVQGFDNPIDAVILGNKMYVLEYDGEKIWVLTFPKAEQVGIDKPLGSISALIDLFPNPVSDHLTLRTTHGSLFFQGLRLYDSKGTLLTHVDIVDRGVQDYSFSMEELPVGMYMLQVMTSKGIALKRVVKKE